MRIKHLARFENIDFVDQFAFVNDDGAIVGGITIPVSGELAFLCGLHVENNETPLAAIHELANERYPFAKSFVAYQTKRRRYVIKTIRRKGGKHGFERIA